MNLAFLHIERATKTGHWECHADYRRVSGANRSTGLFAHVTYVNLATKVRIDVEYDGSVIRDAFYTAENGVESRMAVGAPHSRRAEVEAALGIDPQSRRSRPSPSISEPLSRSIGTTLRL